MKYKEQRKQHQATPMAREKEQLLHSRTKTRTATDSPLERWQTERQPDGLCYAPRSTAAR